MPDGSVVEFPDGMSDDDIGNAITRNQLSSGSSAPKLNVGAPSQLPMKTFSLATPLQNVADFGTGAAEGAANTTAGIAHALGKTEEALVPGSKQAVEPFLSNLEARRQKATASSNTAQKIGKGVEQTAEFFLPDAALGDVAKGFQVAEDAPQAAKALSLLKRGAVSGAGTGAVTAAQGGTPGQVATSAGIGAVSPAVGDAVTSAGNKVAKGIYTRLVRPGMKEFTLDEAREAGTAMADAAPVAATRRGLLKKTMAAKSDVGQQIGNTINQSTNAGKTVDISSAIQPIQDAMDKADQAGNPGLYRQLQGLRDSLTQVYEGGAPVRTSDILQRVNELNGKPPLPEFVQRPLSSMTPEDANVLKRNVQTDVDFTTPNSKALNNTGKAVQGTIGDILRKQIPEIGPLNDRYSGLSNAVSGLKRSTAATERNNPFSLKDILSAMTLAGTGLAHSPEFGAGAGVAGLFGSKAAGSDLAQTLTAAAAKKVNKAAIPAKALRNFYLSQN